MARVLGSYPIGRWFKSYCRYHIWPVGQEVKTPPFHGGIMGSIPVRVTIQRSRKQRKYVVSEFFFYSENPLCSLSVLYFENAESGAVGQAPFGSFFLPEKSSAELTASETFTLDSSNI